MIAAAEMLQAEGPGKPRAAARLQARGPKLIVVCPGAAGELPAFFANMWGRGSLPQARKAIWLRDRPNMMGSQPASDGGVVGPGCQGLGGLTARRAGLAARRGRLSGVGSAEEGRSGHAAVGGAVPAELGAEAGAR